MKKTFRPFADDSAVLSLGDFTLENGTDRVALYGSLDLTRDKAGLKKARALKAALDAVVRALEHDENLPDEIPPPGPTQEVKNPFA